MRNSLQIHFGFHGDDFDPDEITTFLGITPSDTHRRRDINHTSSWTLSSEKVSETTSFTEVIEAFMGTLYPHREKFRLVSERQGIECGLALWWTFPSEYGEPRPAFKLDVEALAFLAAVGASIDLDGYPSM